MNTTKQKNVEAHLKVWLLEGKTITHNQAQKMWGTNRLAVYVQRLRDKGLDIKMTRETFHGDAFGVYRMDQKQKVDRIVTREYLNQV